MTQQNSNPDGIEMKANPSQYIAEHQAEIQNEFKILGEEDINNQEDLFATHPSQYYEFSEKESPFKPISKLFKYMENQEVKLKHIAGLKFAIMAAIIFGISGTLKIHVFQDISFINFTFLQLLVALAFFYFICRQLDVLPFLEDEEAQTRLKVSSVANLVGLVAYIASWNYWPRQYSHLLLCAVPFVENVREGLHAGSFNRNDWIYIGANYIGFIILLAVPDSEKSFNVVGLFWALFAVVCFFVGFQQLKALGKSNMVSVGMVQVLVFSIFLPGFFGIAIGKPPTVLQLVSIILLGIPLALALLLMIRAVQLTKPSHCLLAASISLAIISCQRSVKLGESIVQSLIGGLLSAGCAIFVLYKQQDKVSVMHYAMKEPLV